MNNLVGFSFNDLLPESVKHDAQFKAASQCLDELLAETDAQVINAIIYARIDELEEPLLSNLAWQFHLEGYEGYAMAQTLDEKRALVKNAIQLHWHKGTRWSVERVFELLNMRGEILEWWESDDPTFEPYEFEIEIQADRKMDSNFFVETYRLLNALKNVRSHLRKARIINENEIGGPRIAGATMSGIVCTTYPEEYPG